MSKPAVSVVIRAKDEAENIGRTLDLVKSQTVRDVEIVVVDSGSTDGTGDIAREAGAHVITIPAASFTYGGALNTGTEAASADLVIALSAHAYPPDEGWIERILEPFADERVACAIGTDMGPEGEPLTGRVVQDEALARRYPYFGYSSAAGAFRRSLWEEKEFRPDMPGTEDKEWAWHWLQRGRLVVIDPAFIVEHTHSKDSARDLYNRAEREWRGFGMYLDLPRDSPLEVLKTWWTDQETYSSPRRARLSHRRAARLVGGWVGRRNARRMRQR